MKNRLIDPDIARRIQDVIDMLPSPVFIKDRDCRYIACNRAFEDYVGLPSAKIVGSTVHDIAPTEFAAIYEKADRELMAQGGSQNYEAEVRYADGSYHQVIFFKSVLYDAEGNVDGISGVMFDITERKRLENELARAAREDFLTGALNLRTFYGLATHEFSRFKRSGEAFSLLVFDLDHFKKINDMLGHEAGDNALRQFVQTVKRNLREQDIFARTGGDEFRLLLPDTPPSGAVSLAERIRSEVNQISISAPSGSVTLSMSAGVSSSHADDKDTDDIVRRADAALYQAKAAGRGSVKVDPSDLTAGSSK